MKKVIVAAALCLCAFGASAEIRLQSLNNVKGTNIVLVDDNAPAEVDVTDAVFYTCGKPYKAKNIRCDLKDGVATYTFKFRRNTVFRDCKVRLRVNGRDVTVDIQKSLSRKER